MSSINASVSGDQQIIVSASGGSVSASVTGGIGPQGVPGPTEWSALTGVPTSFPPESHAHGNITHDGRIGSLSNQIVVTTNNGAIVAAPYISASLVSGLATIATSASASDLGTGTVPTARLPVATASNRGAIRIGSGVSIDENGVISVATNYASASHTHDDRYYTEAEVTSLLAGKVGTSDSRLTDAREWSAATVTQAEAEAGASTDRRAFSPLRVFQAIAAWWNASAAKTKLDGIAFGATANATDSQLRDRSTHTGTQTAATISDFAAAALAAAPPTTDASLLTTGTLPDARLSSNIARTSDVTSAVAAVVGAAPESLNTLQELSAALANDASFATTVTNSLAAKAPINNPTFTGTVSGVTKAMVGLGNVDNTSDANKPISTATQTALDGKAASSHAHAWSDIASGVPSTFAPSAHKTSHATGGSDALTPADIGAAPASNFDQGLTTVSIVNFGSVGTASLYLKDTTYVTELASGSLTANRTITFPDAAGVVALVGHSHAISDVTGLQTALDAKALASDFDQALKTTDSPEFAGVEFNAYAVDWVLEPRSSLGAAFDFKATLNGVATTVFSISNTGLVQDCSIPWALLTNVPSTFTPSAHNQAWSTITSTPTTLAGYGITDAAPLSHQHGSITSDGRVGSTSGLVLKTGALGVIEALAQGTAGQVLKVNGGATGVEWGEAAAGGSTSASDLTSGTLTDARLSNKALAAINLYLWSSFR